MRKMLDVFNESWFIYGSIYDDYYNNVDKEVRLLATSNKSVLFASITYDKSIYFHLLYKTDLIRYETGVADYSCHSVPDKISRSQDFWQTDVKNRYWLKISVLFMNAAGLDQIWNSWSKWVFTFEYMMEERQRIKEGKWIGESLFHKKELGPAYINVQEFGGFLILALCPIITSIMLLALEFCAKYRIDHQNGTKVKIIRPITTIMVEGCTVQPSNSGVSTELC
ncbi:unnamed protein product [Orchesella dallaii]|uniref:Uncharacterized protein n=1 Tax=Orchesella dallaii TaxID=48710 RepID=A0ABP1S417_9HEXA